MVELNDVIVDASHTPLARGFPKAVPFDLARLPGELRARIGGTDPEDRSRHDHGTAKDLARAGLSDAEIRWVAEQHPEGFGAKVTDPKHGVPYLALTIAAARAEVDAEQARSVREVFAPVALDWEALERDGLPEIDFVFPPYFPKGARVWGWGPAQSSKSIYALWVAAKLTREGKPVIYISEENPLTEDARRLSRLRPEHSCLVFFNQQGFDLAQPEHAEVLLVEARRQGATLIVLDTLSALWSGDPDSNTEVAAFDRDVLVPITKTGATVVVLDHTGHPGLAKRRPAQAGRGASAKGQKADVVLLFAPQADGSFDIVHGKARMGGRSEPPARLRVIDTPDGGLDIVQALPRLDNSGAAALAKNMIEAIGASEGLSTKALRAAVVGRHDTKLDALKILEADPRVVCAPGRVETPAGFRHAKVWRLAL